MWRKAFKEAAALGLKVAVMQTDGTALACANWDGHLAADVPRCLGTKYEEFMEPGDVARLRHWLANDDESIPLTYMQLMAGGAMRWITVVKAWQGTAWLCYGAVRPLLQQPRPLQPVPDDRA